MRQKDITKKTHVIIQIVLTKKITAAISPTSEAEILDPLHTAQANL
jgi:hypothetical protein